MNGESEKDKIISQGLLYTVGQLFVMFANSGRSLIVAFLLGPVNFGTYTLLNLFLKYGDQSHLGIRHGINRNLPYAIGKKDDEQIWEIQNTGFWWILILAVTVSFGVFLIPFFFKNKSISLNWQVMCTMLFCIIVCGQITSYYYTILRCYQEFKNLTRIRMIVSIVNIILVVVLIYAFGLYGVFGAVVLVQLFTLGLLLKEKQIKLKFRIDPKSSLNLIRLGLPLTMVMFLGTVLSSIDKIMISRMIGQKALGYYGMGYNLAFISINAAISLSYVLFPVMREKFGSGDKESTLARYTLQINSAISEIMPFVLGCVYYGGFLLLAVVLTEFKLSFAVFNILIAGAFLQIMTFAGSNVLLAVDRIPIVIVNHMVCILLNIAMNYYFISHGFGITGVATGTLISITAFFILTSSTIITMAKKGFTSLLEQIAWLLPFIYSALVVLVLEYSISTPLDINMEGISWVIKFFGKCFLFLIMSAPLLFHANKKHGFMKSIMKKKQKKGVESL